MHRALTLCAFVAAAAPGAAAANTLGCGDNAYTHAEVVEHAPGRRMRGPVIALPDSLCADLIEEGKPGIGSLSVHVGEPYGAAGAPRAQNSIEIPPRDR